MDIEFWVDSSIISAIKNVVPLSFSLHSFWWATHLSETFFPYRNIMFSSYWFQDLFFVFSFQIFDHDVFCCGFLWVFPLVVCSTSWLCMPFAKFGGLAALFHFCICFKLCPLYLLFVGLQRHNGFIFSCSSIVV